jgi:hypothetical protein
MTSYTTCPSCKSVTRITCNECNTELDAQQIVTRQAIQIAEANATIAKLREELAEARSNYEELIDGLRSDWREESANQQQQIEEKDARIAELGELLSRSKKGYEANVMCTNVECKNIALKNRSICATCCDWWEMVQERDATIKEQQKQIERLDRVREKCLDALNLLTYEGRTPDAMNLAREAWATAEAEKTQ